MSQNLTNLQESVLFKPTKSSQNSLKTVESQYSITAQPQHYISKQQSAYKIICQDIASKTASTPNIQLTINKTKTFTSTKNLQIDEINKKNITVMSQPNSPRGKVFSQHNGSPLSPRTLSIEMPYSQKKKSVPIKNLSLQISQEDVSSKTSIKSVKSNVFFPFERGAVKARSVVFSDKVYINQRMNPDEIITEPNTSSLQQVNLTLFHLQRCLEKLECFFPKSPVIIRKHITIKQSKFGQSTVVTQGFDQNILTLKDTVDQLIYKSEEQLQKIDFLNTQQTSNQSIEGKSEKVAKQKQIDGYIENTMSLLTKEREMKEQAKNQMAKIQEVQLKHITQLKIHTLHLEAQRL